MAIICFDYGHGGSDPGACYMDRKEKDDNLEIGTLVARELRSCGVIVHETRTCDKTLTLQERTNFERKRDYDFFISFHRNAYKAEKARGVETFTFLNPSKKAENLAKAIQKELKDIGFIDRGVKRDNFHVLRETRSPAILIELGFIDNSLDNKLFESKKEEIVKAISKAILENLGIPYKESEDEGQYYRVVTGSFIKRENAEKRIKELKDAGFESFIWYNT